MNGVSGPLSVLLGQGAIPISMIASYIFLRARYKLLQNIGAMIIVVGIVVVLIPSLLGNSTGNNPIWAMVFFLSNVPTALSTVYKEMAFKGQVVFDCLFMNLSLYHSYSLLF